MKQWRIRAFPIDRRIARAIARHSSRRLEKPLKALTWLADEKLLLLLCCAYWLGSRSSPPSRQRDADHLLLTIGAAGMVSHVLKRIVAQERPDRVEIHGRRHGIPRSGKAFDAFPSGHAVHMSALAAALSRIVPQHRALIWGASMLIALTRVALLAHWASDVIVGGALGIGIEQGLNTLDGDGGN